MKKDKKTNGRENQTGKTADEKESKEKRERKIDEQIEQSFPASDPPSYSQPGNEDLGED